jgi:CheY-like chemotaxis protein
MPSTAKSTNKLEKINVMVMDGSAHAADLLKDALSKLGFVNIEVAKDGYEGIRVMRKKIVHLVFTDWELRVRKRRLLNDEETPASPPTEKDIVPLSGSEFVKRLRRSPQSPNPFVPVVMVVNQNVEEHFNEARDAGVNEIVAKPLQAADFCQRIMSLIDDTRYFITAETYKGPCRRREIKLLPTGSEERRKRQVRLVRRKEFRSA